MMITEDDTKTSADVLMVRWRIHYRNEQNDNGSDWWVKSFSGYWNWVRTVDESTWYEWDTVMEMGRLIITGPNGVHTSLESDTGVNIPLLMVV